MYKFVFADIGEGLHEGKVGEIHAKEGAKIEEGDSLFSVETDKVTSDIPSPVSGVVKKVLIQEGGTVHVGDITHHIDDGSGDDAVPAPQPVAPAPAVTPPPVTTFVARAPQEAPVVATPAASPAAQSPLSAAQSVTTDQRETQAVDVVVIGSGPGGYVAADLLGSGGLKTVVIEKSQTGGVCLNVGCIPTKALLRSAKVFHYIREAEELGLHLDIAQVQLQWQKMQERKATVVKNLTMGVEGIIRNAKGTLVHGEAKILDPNHVQVNDVVYKTQYIIIATGSSPIDLPLPGFADAKNRGIIIDSTAALSLQTVPKSIVIVGGGVIGIEFATLFNELGAKVTVVEGLPDILGPADRDVKRVATKMLTERGIKIFTSAMVKGFENGELVFETKSGRQTVQAERILVAVGRRPNNIGVDQIGVELGRGGAIVVDDMMRTNVPSIFAIGDVINEVMLAHAAYKHAHIASDAILYNQKTLHFKSRIPSCIYTYPEISSVGFTEDYLIENNIPYIKAVWQNTFLGKALTDNDTVGFTKLLISKKYGEILGAHIINSNSSDIISEIALAMKLESTVFELASTIHPHPSAAEGLYEAAQIAKKLFLKEKGQ